LHSLHDKVFKRRIYGQAAAISIQRGLHATELEERLVRRHDREVVLVPWQLAEGGTCELGAWGWSYRWLPADSPVFLVASPREPQYSNKPPVVDVPPTTYLYPSPWFDYDLQNLSVYLDGEDPQQVDSMLATLDTTAITAYEFLSLYESLPTMAECESQPERVEQRLEHWEATHPELLDRLVVQKTLRFARSRKQEINKYFRERQKHEPGR